MGAQGFLRQLDLDEQLLQGIAAARDGRRSEARAILMQVVEREERNEQAWLWLAGVMDDPADVRTCLENVLELNPANSRARQGLDWLNARYAPPAEAQAEEPRVQNQGPNAQSPEPRARQADSTATVAAAAPRDLRASAADAGASNSQHAPTVGAPSARKTENTALGAADLPCPYCGAPTVLSIRSCTQCRQSLMVQVAPPEQPSRWLGLLAGVWTLCGAALGLGALAYLAAAVLAYQGARFGAQGAAEQPAAPLPLGLITAAVALLVVGGGMASLAGALRRRQIGAYYAVVIALPIGIALAGFALLRGLAAAPLAGAPIAPGIAAALAGALGGLPALLLALLLVAAVLGGMAYRDFFGPMERIQPVVKPADHTTHYNSGVLYKNRGMWYMATREWERAVAQAPRDINYLRALGLAYAQLGRYPQARELIERALRLAPNHAGLLGDQKLVDGLAAKAARA